MQKIGNPIPLFLDARGNLLDAGQIYVGVVNGDPQTSPVTVYWDKNLTQVAAQPLRTIGGRIVNGASPSSVYIAEADYSMRILDSDGAQVDYSPSVFTDNTSFQPASDNLTSVSDATLTTFGLSLLSVPDVATLNTELGTGGALPLTGGTVTGDIKRQGNGSFAYITDGSLAGFRVIVTANGAADPTTQSGDLWLEKSA